MSSNLWPNGNNKELIICVANYLQHLLNENKSKLDEVSIDSLQVATESLQTIISPDDEQLPPSPFSLTQLYEAYKSSPSNTGNDEEKSASSTPLPANIAQRRKKFLEFIEVLKKHNFFKDVVEGSSDFRARMEKARVQYNTRFKEQSIDSIDWITDPSNDQQRTPMDTDDSYDSNKVVTEEERKEAEKLKNEGNQLLGKRKYKEAVEKYSAAIDRNPQNAVYFSNRAAAYTYLKKYTQAVSDARKASELDANYVKAYVREGLAEYEMKNYENALAAYQKALDKTPSSDKSWETYMEKVEDCKLKIEEAKHGNTRMNAAGGGGGGGAGDMNANNPFAGLGGGAGGMDFGNLAGLLQNPQIKQMAQQFMQDPNAMKQMGDLMGQMGMAGAAGGGDGAAPGGGGGNDMNVNELMGDLLQNPQKAQAVFQQALNDPEAKQMMQQDPSLKPLIDKIVGGEYAAFLELSQKPEAMKKVKKLVQKYYKQ
eukprot:CAMPEP_0197023242 /NCGR_PEP_ID=MMETSP1384-20130603/3999_1 /TAXON_ID=29189 /ORGANISM="Ammonia sp." /LENGTH=481 /DNA_ID=CAMNT_0042451433 /DNA_START=40 /DNA_END=1485 /DNA_ORIENTATION=+